MKIQACMTAAIAAAVLSSCTNDLKVQDLSFEFEASVSYDTESARNTLVLDLVRGEGGTFNATYSIDGEGKLLEEDGKPFESRSSFTPDKDGRKVFLMKDVHKGSHMLEMEISNESYTQKIRQTLEVSEEPFHFEPSVITEGTGKSFLMLILSEGHDRKLYTGSVVLDGERKLTGDRPVEMDFSEESVWSITFPYLRPGSHKVAITVNDGDHSESAEVEFEEPLKYPELELRLSSDNDGRYRFDIPFNPYGIRFRGKTVLSFKAQCLFISCPPDEKLKVKNITDTVRINTDGMLEENMKLSQRDSIVNCIVQMKEKSAKYRKVHTGGMVDPDWDYIVTGYEDHYYYVAKEDFIVDLEWEDVPGVTLTVDNRIGDIIFNGKLKVKGEFNASGSDEPEGQEKDGGK